MRVVYLTAGAAGMYCGSCMRDNTLVAALRARGRDVLLVPLYTPIRTDEPDVSEPTVLYGGLNVYLQQKSALFRHTPGLIDRLLDAPSLLRAAARRAGRASPEVLGAMTVSMLLGERGRQRKELRRLVRHLRETQADLVNLPNALFVGVARAIRDAIGVPVVCTLTGEDVFLDRLPEPWRGEALSLIREKVRDVDGFIAVSRYYGDYCRERFAIPRERLHVVPLGVRLDDDEPSAPPETPFTIGYLARICPEKGLHVLCEAFEILHRAGRACRLRVAGYVGEADRAYWQSLLRRARDRGWIDALDHVGEVDRPGKAAFLRSLHVLSVPTVYRESKGLYVLEAMARGVPVVQPAHGAFPEVIEATGGGVLVEPGSPAALAEALAAMMDDRATRERLGREGRIAVRRSFTAETMAERAWSAWGRIAEAARH